MNYKRILNTLSGWTLPLRSHVYPLSVVTAQTFNFYPGTAPNIGEIKLWGAIYGALLRPCVPLFVMITGALLLPVRGEISVFYKKRIPARPVAVSDLVRYLQSVSLDHRSVGHQAGSHSRLFPLFGRGSDASVAACLFGLHCSDSF